MPDEGYMARVESEKTLTSVTVEPGRFYGFFDETGDEKLVPGNDLFAFSGICIIDGIDREGFEETWEDLKLKVFKIPEGNEFHSVRHSKKLRRKDDKLLSIVNALSSFNIKYLSSCIMRKAIIDEESRDKDTQVVNALLGGLSSSSMYLSSTRVQSDAWYFEHSHRLAPFIMLSSRQPRYHLSSENQGTYFIKKSSRVPFMEVADFVTHVVNNHLSNLYINRRSHFEAAFEIIFRNGVNGVFEITEAILGPIRIPPS